MAKIKSKSLKWLAKNSAGAAPAIAVLTVIGVAVSYISVRFAMVSMKLIDAATGKSDVGFKQSIAAIILLIAVQLALQAAYTVLDIRVRALYKNSLQRKLFDAVLTRDAASIGKMHSGEIMNRLTSDINVINSNMLDVIPSTVTLVFTVVFSFAAMFRLDSSLSLICLALGPFVMLSATVYGRRMKGLYKKCQLSDGKTRSFMQECIQSIIAIKAFCGERKASALAKNLQDINYRLNMKRALINVAVNIMYYIAMTAAYYFAVAWCAYKIKIGIMTVGQLTAIVQLVGSVQSPFRDIAGIIPKFYATAASAERIMEIEQLDGDFSAEEDIPKGDFVSVTADGVSFSYDDEAVLSGASLEVKRGEIAVLYGMSGKGKSTFFKLLLGILKPSDGRIAINFSDGSAPACAQLRKMFSYVPQGNMIISGTIRENIAFLDAGGDGERVVCAAKNACIWDYISELPDGLDTVLGEGGMGLSEGQVQRIAIARAFYHGAPIILLDEATSALDEATELEILKNIKAMKDKTCFIITHRPGAFEICDRKILLENKKFVCK